MCAGQADRGRSEGADHRTVHVRQLVQTEGAAAGGGVAPGARVHVPQTDTCACVLLP